MSKNYLSYIRFLFYILIAGAVISNFVAFSPVIYNVTSLDTSWTASINQATVRHFAFGKDLIFTFGPYGFLYTKAYHPVLYTSMIILGIYLAFAYLACLFFLLKNTKLRWVIGLSILLASLPLVMGSLYYSLALLILLTIFKMLTSSEKLSDHPIKNYIYLAFIFSSLGLLSLIQGTFFVLSIGIVALCALTCIAYRQLSLTVACIAIPAISLIGWWMMIDQPLTTLPAYFLNTLEIIIGYTEAMSSPGRSLEVALYVLGSIVVCATIYLQKWSITKRSLLLMTYSLFLFLSFKAGFVRHDAHAITSAISLAMGSMFLVFLLPENKKLYLSLIFSLFISIFILNHYVPFFHNIDKTISNNYISMYKGIMLQINNPHELKKRFQESLDKIHQQMPIPALKGTTDIYSHEQNMLLASDNIWNPRPIMQSYSVYTPKFAAINREHLLKESSPDNIIFKIQPIDSRFPALEDGLSWPILLIKYHPTALTDGFLFLEKKPQATVENPALFDINKGTYHFNDTVHVPESNQLMYVTFDIKPTLFGKLCNLLYKPTRLKIDVILADGSEKTYRLVSSMVSSPFLISPLIENTEQFQMLYSNNSLLNNQKIISFKIRATRPWLPIWNSEYTLAFKEKYES